MCYTSNKNDSKESRRKKVCAKGQQFLGCNLASRGTLPGRINHSVEEQNILNGFADIPESDLNNRKSFAVELAKATRLQKEVPPAG